jgi:transposase
MEHYAGLDASLKETSVCIVDGAGKIIRETKVASEPEALVGYFSSLTINVVRIGLEAGPLSQWLHAALTQAGFEVVLLETRHVKAALSAMPIKTDRRDARGIAQLLRMGWYRPVHGRTLPSQEVRAIITARKTLLGKLIDIELSIRGILRGFGLKVGAVTRKSFEIRVRELMAGQSALTAIMEMLWGGRWRDVTIVAGSNADGASQGTAAQRLEQVPHSPGARQHDHRGHRDASSEPACRRHYSRHRAPSAEEARTE